MNLDQAEKISQAVGRLTRLRARLSYLAELDAAGSRTLPGFIGSEIFDNFSLQGAVAIRAAMRGDISAQLEAAKKELVDLGVEQ